MFVNDKDDGIESSDKLIRIYEKLSKARKLSKSKKLSKSRNSKSKKLFKY